MWNYLYMWKYICLFDNVVLPFRSLLFFCFTEHRSHQGTLIKFRVEFSRSEFHLSKSSVMPQATGLGALRCERAKGTDEEIGRDNSRQTFQLWLKWSDLLVSWNMLEPRAQTFISPKLRTPSSYRERGQVSIYVFVFKPPTYHPAWSFLSYWVQYALLIWGFTLHVNITSKMLKASRVRQVSVILCHFFCLHKNPIFPWVSGGQHWVQWELCSQTPSHIPEKIKISASDGEVRALCCTGQSWRGQNMKVPKHEGA